MLIIRGPRQVGKTTLLKLLKHWLIQDKKISPENIVFLTFEDPETLEEFSISPKNYVKKLVENNERTYFFIDEFQYLKNSGQTLKLLYDLFDNIKFIVTGSSSLELTDKTAKFMVGRAFYFQLWPFSFAEFLDFKKADFTLINKSIPSRLQRLFSEYLTWGGYPAVIKANDDETKRTILKNIYSTFISKDIIEMLKIAQHEEFQTLTRLLSLRIGNLITYSSLAQDLNSYFKEIKKYLHILEETFVISLIKPYSTNKATEIKKNPKTYFIDIGLRNYMARNLNPPPIRSDLGSLVENYVFSQLLFAQEDKYEIKYWRTQTKTEVDFVIDTPNGIIPIEVKYRNFKKPQISRSFRSFINHYHPPRAIVMTKDFFGKMKLDSTTIDFIPMLTFSNADYNSVNVL